MSYIDPIASMLGPWSQEFNLKSILLRISIAIVCAALIGWERSSKRHAAGFRTFILVSVGCTVAMMLDRFLAHGNSGYAYLLSAATIVGIAIVTTNSVLFSSRNQIKGLTTAVGMWACGIVGLSAGAGYYTISAIGFAAVYCSLSFFPAIETYLKHRSNHFDIHLELTKPCYLQNFVTTIRRLGLTIDDVESNPAYIGSGLSVYTVSISIVSPELKKYKTHHEIVEALSTLDYVYYIEEMYRQ